MSKMSHSVILCAGVVLSQLALAPAYASNSPRSLPGTGLTKYHEVVKGHVDAPEGGPAVGVNVVVKGSRKGTVTDVHGDFTINANPGDVLIISGVGFASQQVKVGSGDVSLTLQRASTQMEDVVVTALGIQKQARALGYSTTEVDGSKFTQSREVNIGNALTGQVAGVNVSGDATGPYGSSRVVIRGITSIAGNNQPLYVIDGIPYDNTNQGSTGQWGGQDFGDGLSNINPDDIANIQVLKGVAASNLYGFRGGNGAILITTKSGAKNKGLSVEVNDNFTANMVVDERDNQYVYGQGVLGLKPTNSAAAQASEYYSWGAKIDGSPTVNFLGNQTTYSPFAKDNFKNFYKTGTTNQVNVALNGSNDHGNFRLSLGDLALNTFIPNSGMKQQTINFNSSYNITKRLSMTLSADYVFENVNNRVSFSDAPGNVVASTLYLGNTFDIRWEKPGWQANNYELLPGTDQYFNNAYFVAEKFINQTQRNRLTGGLTLKYNFTDWLYASGTVTRDGYIFDLLNVTPTGTGYQIGGSLTQTETNFHELNYSGVIGANKKFGSDFSFNAQVGANSMDNVNYSYGVTGIQPFVIPFFYSANNITNKPFTYTYNRYHVNSVYGSADLGFRNYLFLTVTARNDWFSTLNINTDSYLYPSVSGSFVFSDAFHLPTWISFGKLRASYGEGSNGASAYQNALTYGLQGYSINSQPLGYVSNTSIPNAFLKPVRIQEDEIGLNMDFLNHRFGFDVAVYNKKTTDDILPVTISPTSGYPSNYENIGVLNNKGIEVLLNVTPVSTRHFTWDLSFNFSDNRNRVMDLGPGVQSIVINGAYPRWGSEVSVDAYKGLPYGQIMGFAYAKNAQGQHIIDSVSGEPVQTGVVPLGSGNYNLYGGLTNTFRYKGFSLSFLIDYKYGAKIYSGTNLLDDYYGLQKNTLQGRANGYVAPGVDGKGNPNTIAVPAQQYWQDISAGGADHIAEEFIYDASFIKLRSLTLGYSLPSAVLRGTFIKGVNINLVGRNLLILMKHTPNIDPESGYNNTNGQGLELSDYPPIRSMGVNVHVNF